MENTMLVPVDSTIPCIFILQVMLNGIMSFQLELRLRQVSFSGTKIIETREKPSLLPRFLIAQCDCSLGGWEITTCRASCYWQLFQGDGTISRSMRTLSTECSSVDSIWTNTRRQCARTGPGDTTKLPPLSTSQGEFDRVLENYPRSASEIYKLSLGADQSETLKTLKRLGGRVSLVWVNKLQTNKL